MDKELFRQKANTFGLSHVAEQLYSFGRPCFRMVGSRAAVSGTIQSKIGGQPDVSLGFGWPMWKDLPLSFIAQVNLADLKSQVDLPLPTQGLIAFFYSQDQETWGFDPKDRGSWAISYFPEGGELSKAPWPEGLSEFARYPEKALEPVKGFSLPDEWSRQSRSLGLTNEQGETFAEFRDWCEGAGAPYHKLVGYPNPVQNEMELECQLVSNGIYCGDPEGYQSEEARSLQSGAEDWRLILQVDSDEDSGMMWGDVGMIYYWMRVQDLAARNFDRSWMILQCC